MPADQEEWSEGHADAPFAAPEKDADSDAGGRQNLWWVPGVITVLTIGAVIAVTVWQMHLNLLFTNTTTTGGDTGAHIAMPKYLESLLSHGHITGWDPGWYDGFPLYTFYFTIPDLFIAIGGWIIPYDIAFKLGTILGSVSLPICAWACGRFFRLRPPIPTIMAAVTLPFLFDYTFTIYGGNLFSTLAGEYAYSFSLSLAILFIGLFACAVREGRHRGWAAVVLAVCVMSHIVGGMYALGGAAIITVVELLPNSWGIRDDGILRVGGSGAIVARIPWWRTLWWAASTVLVGILLTGVWLGPFGLEHAYSISMGYTNVEGWALYFREADTWALVLAGLGAITAVVVRSRFGISITLLGIASGVATAIDPQGSLYNVRLLPLWFISVYLMAAWAFGTGCIAVAMWWRRLRLRRWERTTALPPSFTETPPDSVPNGEVPAERSDQREPSFDLLTPHRPPAPRWKPAAVSGAILGLLGALLVVVPPFIPWMVQSIPGVHTGPNEVSNWSQYNYIGYEGQSSYPEYRSIMLTMQDVAKRYGCGRAMWEYSASENRFGTPEALMLLPYWTNGCIDSMEGLLFESSATTPYHFLNQAELSAGPSEPEVGLDYGPLDVTEGVQHLQLLGVKYFMAETPTVEAEANADPALKLVAKTGPWTYDYDGATTHTTWNIYVVRELDPRHAAAQRPGRALGRQAGAFRSVELADAVGGLVPRPEPLERRAGAERPDHVAPNLRQPHRADGRPRPLDDGFADHHHGLEHRIPRLAGRHARAGEDLVLPQLARQRCARTLARLSEPHGRGTDQSRRAADVRGDVRQLPGPSLYRASAVVGLVGFFAWPRLRSRRAAARPRHAPG